MVAAASSPVPIEEISGGVTAPIGFAATGVSCGLKKAGALDLALVDAGAVVPAAAVFTTNRVAAAPVLVSDRKSVV